MDSIPLEFDESERRRQWDEQVPQMAALLGDAVDWYRRCCDVLSLRPTRSSPAGKDLRDRHWGERPELHSPLHWGLSAAHFRMVAACDYVDGLTVLLRRWPPQPFAPLPQARAAIETCARTVWMLDPDIDRPTRVKRMLAERIAEERWLLTIGAGTAGLMEVGTVADALGIAIKRDTAGLPSAVIEVPYPKLQEIVPDIVALSTSRRRRDLWRRLAGITHGSPLGVIADMTPSMAGSGPDYDAVLHVRAKDLAVLSTTVAAVFVAAVDAVGTRTGWRSHRAFADGRERLSAALAAVNRRHLDTGTTL